jgi:uncharacterized membrane protein YdjX (TVP38/TMEM64 family)
VTHNPVRRQLLLAAALVAAVTVLWLSAALQAAVFDALRFSKDTIAEHPIATRVLFVLLSAGSALLFLFSSLPLIPIAVHAWGQFETLVLLATGWFMGGAIAYGIGRRFGRRAAEYFVAPAALERYGKLFSARMTVAEVALVKLALPSEVTSLALGVIRYPAHKLMIVLPASELPFAVWTVYLSAAFIEDRRLVFVLVLLAGLAAVAVVTRHLVLGQR